MILAKFKYVIKELKAWAKPCMFDALLFITLKFMKSSCKHDLWMIFEDTSIYKQKLEDWSLVETRRPRCCIVHLIVNADGALQRCNP